MFDLGVATVIGILIGLGVVISTYILTRPGYSLNPPRHDDEPAPLIDRPSVIKEEYDDQERYHCIHGPAVVWSDGKEEYYVHGVIFSKNLFTELFIKNSYSGADILAMRNAEQKSVAIQLIGFDYIINDVKEYNLVDEADEISKKTGNPLKYQVIEFKISANDKVRVVKVQDHTTGKSACMGVPIIPQTSTCRGAIAWTFGLDEWNYDPGVET